MTTNTDDLANEIARILVDLALAEEALARDLAAATAYWQPTPDTVIGHHRAAEVLRAQVDALLRPPAA